MKIYQAYKWKVCCKILFYFLIPGIIISYGIPTIHDSLNDIFYNINFRENVFSTIAFLFVLFIFLFMPVFINLNFYWYDRNTKLTIDKRNGNAVYSRNKNSFQFPMADIICDVNVQCHSRCVFEDYNIFYLTNNRKIVIASL